MASRQEHLLTLTVWQNGQADHLQDAGHWSSVGQLPPSSNVCGQSDVALFLFRETNRNYVWLHFEARVELKQCDVVFERVRIVIAMHYHPLHWFRDWFQIFEVASQIVLANDGNQRSKEARLRQKVQVQVQGLVTVIYLAVRSSKHPLVIDQYAATLGFDKQTEPSSFLNQHLPRT